MSNIATGANSTVDIAIERWSTEDERQKLITTFKEKGASKLLDTLQDLKRVGYIRLPTSIGYDLHFARQVALDEGGQKILIATDRKIGFAEARNQPRTIARGQGRGQDVARHEDLVQQEGERAGARELLHRTGAAAERQAREA
jgi:hypothetical protein